MKNYYHTPYLIDLMQGGSQIIPHFHIPVPEVFIIPEVRERLFVPGSAVADISLFGK